MESFEYWVPTRILFGKGAESKTAAEIQRLGVRRVLIVSGGASARRSGLLDRIEEQLRQAGIVFETFEGTKPNPRLDHAREGVRRAIALGAELILAVGGGSVIDTAKGIAHGAANPNTDIWEFWTGRAPLEKSLPVGVVLTISAAGSETSDSSVLTDETSGQKRGLSSPLNRPAFAVMDPLLTLTLPVWQVKCGVVDIMMHTMDRYFNPIQDNQLTDAIAEALLRTVIRCGRAAVADPTDYAAMSELMWAGSLSHNGLTGLGGVKDFAPHQLGHELSARFDVSHGASLSTVWGSWADFCLPRDPARFARFGREVWGIREPDDGVAARTAIDATVRYFEEIGMPTCFSALGIGLQDEKQLAVMARAVTFDGSRKIGSFVVLGEEEILEIYRRCNH